LNWPYSFLENFLSSRRRNNPDRSCPDNNLFSAPGSAQRSLRGNLYRLAKSLITSPSPDT
jgi:hypothetical protein